MKRVTIKIGESQVNCFQNDDGEYLYSLTDMAALIGKEHKSAGQFLASKRFKSGQGEGFQPFNFKDGNLKFTLAPSWVVIKYLVNHAYHNGEARAMMILEALASESLDTRASVAMNQLNPSRAMAEIYGHQQRTDETLATEERKNARDLHNLYQKACKGEGFSPRHCHDYITTLVFGQTAEQARLCKMAPYSDPIWDDETIGINHQADADKMAVYRKVKSRFLAYRSGDYRQRIDRAYNEVMGAL